MKLEIFGKVFEMNLKNQVISTSTLHPSASWEAWGDFLGTKGHVVDHDTALKVAVVIRCADVVAKTMASLGCHLYQTDAKGKGKVKAEKHPLYNLLRTLPNPETTAYEFWHMYFFNLMLTRGAYAKVVKDGTGRITEIWNIPTRYVQLKRNELTKEQYLQISGNDGSTELIYDFMYTPGLRFKNSEVPEDFINIASEVLGLTTNLNKFAKDYFENGSNMGGFVSYPGSINEEAFTKFKEDWGKTYAGVMNQHKWAILEGGFTATKMDSNPANAQALESRKFQIAEVCRLMGVPPHKAFYLEGATYSSVEQLNIEYVQETIDPFDERVSQTIYKDLLSDQERKSYHARFNIKKLLKGDIKTQTEHYNAMRQGGVYSANTILELEDMPLLTKEEGGDLILVNGNMISLKNAEHNLPKSMIKGGKNND